MAKLMNGEITHINSDIVADLEELISMTEQIAYESESKSLKDTVMRVKDYLANYKLDENHGE